MDDLQHPAAGGALPLQGPHWHRGPAGSESPAFVPLRLVLQSSETTIDVTRADVVLGRHTEADVRLPLPDVSRRHCRLVFAEGRWQIFDLHSLNGIYVNGARVEQAQLCHDDTLRIGGFLFDVDLRKASPTVTLPAPEPGAGHDHLRSIVEALPPTLDDDHDVGKRRRAG